MLVITWSELKGVLRRLAAFLPVRPDAVVGVGRSGLIPAAIMCRYLGCQRFYAVFVEKYGEGKPPPLVHDEPLLVWGFAEDLEGATTLIVDDVAVTGSTLSLVKEYVKRRNAGEVYTLVIVKKSGVDVDFYGLETDECVVFPWE